MSDAYILDACALIALLKKEEGADKVTEVYKRAVAGKASLAMHKMNLLEVYYDLYRTLGKTVADEVLEKVKLSQIRVISELIDEVFAETGRLKASYRISLADSIALAEASVSGCALMTSDHHEFDAIEQAEDIRIFWIR